MAHRFLTLLFFFLFINSSYLTAQEIPPKPEPPRLVNDFAGFLNPDDIARLETELVNFSNQTSNQIVVVIMKDIGGYDIDEIASLIGDKWKVGQKSFDNGVVLLIKPKTAESKGEVSIQVGYGLEGAIPDAVCKRIIENEILPKFRKGKNTEGIDAGLQVIMKLAKGEYNSATYMKQKKTAPAGAAAVMFIVLILLIFIFSRSKSQHHSVGKSLPFWIGMGMMSNAFGNKSGGFSNFSSGSGHFGGFGGGGGFGGFGGGSFGGGGASGSW